MSFEYLSPVQIIFGNGRINELGKIAKKYGDKAFIVTGRNSMKNHGHLERILKDLEEKKVSYFVFDKISPNPRSDEVDEASNLVRKNRYNLIIGLGGGSALDAAKAISVGVNHESICEFIGGRTVERNSDHLPVIAIPTTSGSGAEVTKGAIITDTKRNLKSGVRGPALFPRVAIVDSELTYTMSKKVTTETGFDALTHAIETYVANKSTPIGDLCSQEAVKLISQYLPRAINRPMDKEAREKMSLASLFGGLNIANTGTCLPHRLQQAMGSIIEISHGRGMATIYPAWLKRASYYREEKFNRISEILQGKEGEGYISVVNFMKKIGIYSSLKSFADKTCIDLFLEKLSGNIENDPIPNIDENLMRDIYEESFY